MTNAELFSFYSQLLFSAVSSIFLVGIADLSILKRRLPPLGFIVVLMYCMTYGLGLSLWRLDPSSLFGYASKSTISSLNTMATVFSIGILSISFSYLLSRTAINYLFPRLRYKSGLSALAISSKYPALITRLSFSLIFASSFLYAILFFNGLLSRQPDAETFSPFQNLIEKIIVGSSFLSRLSPVGLVLLPFAWKRIKPHSRVILICAVALWILLAGLSGSRGVTLSIFIYYLIGLLVFNKLPLKYFITTILLAALVFVPIAENMRVQRVGDSAYGELTVKYELFQIGKQLLGTSHEFYLFLDSEACKEDLNLKLSANPSLENILTLPASELKDISSERWNVARLLYSCSERDAKPRFFENMDRLSTGLLPTSIFPNSPNLFDGQELAEKLSDDLRLRPGEISSATISLFADAWWRIRWFGVVIICICFGSILAVIQSLILCIGTKSYLLLLLAQLLAVSLFGTWINNTILTVFWYLFWDFPKSLIALSFLALLLRKPRNTYCV